MAVVSAALGQVPHLVAAQGSGAAQAQAAGNGSSVFNGHVSGMSALENPHVIPQPFDIGFEGVQAFVGCFNKRGRIFRAVQSTRGSAAGRAGLRASAGCSSRMCMRSSMVLMVVMGGLLQHQYATGRAWVNTFYPHRILRADSRGSPPYGRSGRGPIDAPTKCSLSYALIMPSKPVAESTPERTEETRMSINLLEGELTRKIRL